MGHATEKHARNRKFKVAHAGGKEKGKQTESCIRLRGKYMTKMIV